MTQLIVIRGESAGERFDLEEFPVVVGRESFRGSIRIHDEETSRKHFLIKRRGRLFIIQDLDSKNGTYLNGERIVNSILRNGDKILIGSTEMNFVTSEACIQFPPEIKGLHMQVDEEIGTYIGERIPLLLEAQKTKHSSIISSKFQFIKTTGESFAKIKQIFDFHSNIMVITDIQEAARALLKFIGTILPNADRAGFFIWQKHNQYLIPYAAKQFRKKRHFQINKSSFEDVLNRRLGVILKPTGVHENEITRVILPMIYNNNVIGILHLETSDRQAFATPLIEQAIALLARCAPSFESLILRQELDNWLVGSMETLLATIEAKDTYTHGHSERVSRYSMAIANELKLDRETKKLLLASALCHDIGKVGIPDNILKKASLLSMDEYEEMKLHPTIGADIISHMPDAEKFISGVKYHHEKWDGTGYPEGLVGEEIPFFARIVCIADTYDAMVSGRSYSGFMDQNDAAEKLVSEKELFDPEILKAFVRAQDSGALTLKTSTLSRAHPERESHIDYSEEFNTLGEKKSPKT